jgi:hypothetical protein
MEQRIAGTSGELIHRAHPEVIPESIDLMYRLFDGHLDLKTQAIALDDLDRIDRQISTDEDPLSTAEMIHQNETRPRTYRPPQGAQTAVA